MAAPADAMKYTVAELAETFAELLRELGSALDGEGVEWMLVGGLAVGAWTEPRGTKDCDLAIAVPEDAASLAAALTDAGLVVVRGDLERAQKGAAVRLHYERPGVPALAVDLLCAGTPFEHEALARRTRLAVFGVSLPVVQADDLIIYKLIAGRPQDLADIDKLLRFGRAPADDDRMRRWAQAWSVEERLDSAIAAARRATSE